MLKAERKQFKEHNDNGWLKRNVFSINYLKRLFPTIKGQKPGTDFYVYIVTSQFIMCIYIIGFFNNFDTIGTQSIDKSQFNQRMVFFLFFTVGLIFMERYIVRASTKVVVRKIGSVEAMKNDGDPTRKDTYKTKTQTIIFD